MLNARSTEQVGRPIWDAQEIRNRWTSPIFNLETDSQLVETSDGTLVAVTSIFDPDLHVRIGGIGGVHPDYEGRGIGTALCQWAEARARQSIPRAPDGARVAIAQGVLDSDTAAQGLLRSQDYTLVRHSLLMIIGLDAPRHEPVLPSGVSIRNFVRDQDLHALILARREAFKDTWGYVDSPFQEDYEEWVHWLDSDLNLDPSLWLLAVDGEEIAGAALCEATVPEDPQMGFVDYLFVRRWWRRQGIALALLHHSFGEFCRRGKRRVALAVDAQSLTGATRPYEKAGMRVERRYAIYEKVLRPGRDLSTQSLG